MGLCWKWKSEFDSHGYDGSVTLCSGLLVWLVVFWVFKFFVLIFFVCLFITERLLFCCFQMRKPRCRKGDGGFNGGMCIKIRIKGMVQTVIELKKLRIHFLCITIGILAEKGLFLTVFILSSLQQNYLQKWKPSPSRRSALPSSTRRTHLQRVPWCSGP